MNRFTSLPIALNLFYKKEITLLNPETWEDRNDAYYLECYRDKTKASQRARHLFFYAQGNVPSLEVFSHGSAGVCIEFNRDKLLKAIPSNKGFKHDAVRYRWISDLQKQKPPLEFWPFLKRKPFEDEGEYRIIFESETENLRAKPVAIDLSSIRKVTLSPWLPDAVAKSVISVTRKIDGCSKLDVSRSSLIDNAGWRAIID